MAEDDVINPGRVHAAAFQRGLDHGGRQFGGGHVPQRSAEITDGGADRGNDGYSSHDGLLGTGKMPASLRPAGLLNGAGMIPARRRGVKLPRSRADGPF